MNSSAYELLETKGGCYTKEELAHLDQARIPKHIAIMMDGNRRWAKKKCLPSSVGHWRGADTLTKIVKASSELGIRTLTVYSFSTENWQRSPEEIKDLMHLYKVSLIKQRENMIKEGVKLDTIGDLSQMPLDVQEELNRTKKATANGEKIDLILALNYGSRDEIKRAAIKMLQECLDHKIDPTLLSEEAFSKHLDSAKWPDPSLIIRTSGEHRLSNFMLWQASYAEFYFKDVLWPDFNEQHLLEIILDYQKRERRSGR
jgi:undecaprenyl diphosphate synthase